MTCEGFATPATPRVPGRPGPVQRPHLQTILDVITRATTTSPDVGHLRDLDELIVGHLWWRHAR
jgi:hypothetical protein